MSVNARIPVMNIASDRRSLVDEGKLTLEYVGRPANLFHFLLYVSHLDGAVLIVCLCLCGFVFVWLFLSFVCLFAYFVCLLGAGGGGVSQNMFIC